MSSVTKTLAILLIFILPFSISSCGKNNEEKPTLMAKEKENITLHANEEYKRSTTVKVGEPAEITDQKQTYTAHLFVDKIGTRNGLDFADVRIEFDHGAKFVFPMYLSAKTEPSSAGSRIALKLVQRNGDSLVFEHAPTWFDMKTATCQWNHDSLPIQATEWTYQRQAAIDTNHGLKYLLLESSSHTPSSLLTWLPDDCAELEVSTPLFKGDHSTIVGVGSMSVLETKAYKDSPNNPGSPYGEATVRFVPDVPTSQSPLPSNTEGQPKE